jgi:hypothetical protein
MSNKIKNLRVEKPKVDQDLVKLLNQTMEQVLAGEVLGLVVLTANRANDYNYGAAGDMQLSEVMNSFHAFEFDQRVRAWMENNRK